MTTITLPLASERFTNYCVDAEIVDVAPHLAHIATFAVDVRGHRWVVSHVETGHYVAFARTKRGAMSIAWCKLATLTPDEFMERCVASVADYVARMTWSAR